MCHSLIIAVALLTQLPIGHTRGPIIDLDSDTGTLTVVASNGTGTAVKVIIDKDTKLFINKDLVGKAPPPSKDFAPATLDELDRVAKKHSLVGAVVYKGGSGGVTHEGKTGVVTGIEIVADRDLGLRGKLVAVDPGRQTITVEFGASQPKTYEIKVGEEVMVSFPLVNVRESTRSGPIALIDLKEWMKAERFGVLLWPSLPSKPGKVSIGALPR